MPRPRSSSVSGENPLETPISQQEFELARLVASINNQSPAPRPLPRTPVPRPSPREPLPVVDYAQKPDNEARKDRIRAQIFQKVPGRIDTSESARSSSSSSSELPLRPSNYQPPRFEDAAEEPQFLPPNTNQTFNPSGNMSFQNYADQPGGVGGNPRQAPPSPSQGAPHPNGMNGGMLAGMVGYPTPAGHQSDLNHIMATIEELSRLNAQNQALSAGVVEKMGRIREKAKTMDLNNDGLLQLAATDLNDSTTNLERENKELRAALEKANHDKKENFKLACHGANILADVLEKMHVFKVKHETDTLIWHKNYRNQLAYEREENLRLTNEINDKVAAAVRANGHLRDMRRYLTDHNEMQELRIEVHKYRTACRFFRRMAMPLLHDSDSEWSDDDDLIDPEEKKRQAKEKKEKETKPEGEDAS